MMEIDMANPKSSGKLSVTDPDPRYPKTNWIPEAFHLIPVLGIQRVAGIMRKGEMAGRGPDDWRTIPVEEHLNHALAHIFRFIAGDRDEDHLSHAGCRVLMALSFPLPPQTSREDLDPQPLRKSGWGSNPWSCLSCDYVNPVGTRECLNCDRPYPSVPTDDSPFP